MLLEMRVPPVVIHNISAIEGFFAMLEERKSVFVVNTMMQSITLRLSATPSCVATTVLVF